MKTKNKAEMRTFVEQAIANGAIVKTYAKFARVQATEAQGGEVIETILANGIKETSNTANAGDWIVTNPGGEQYIVPSVKFGKKYEPAPECGEGWFKPTGGVQKFMTVSEPLQFICSWGEEQYLGEGAKINVSDLDDIYGVNEPEFSDTYRVCDESGKFC